MGGCYLITFFVIFGVLYFDLGMPGVNVKPSKPTEGAILSQNEQLGIFPSIFILKFIQHMLEKSKLY